MIDEIQTLPEFMAWAVCVHANRTAVIPADSTSPPITYNDLQELISHGACTLHQMGFNDGDRVILYLESQPLWAAALFAILTSNLIAVPVSETTSTRELQAITQHVDTKAILCSQRTKIQIHSPNDLTLICLEELFVRRPREEGMNNLFTVKPVDLAIIAYTSGSSNCPRAVELTHKKILANLKATLSIRHASPSDRFLSMLPPSHMFELVGGLLAPLACGAGIVYPQSLLPNRLLAAIRDHHVSFAMVVPALVRCLFEEVLDQLIDDEKVDSERRNQSFNEVVLHVLSTLGNDDFKQVQEWIQSHIGSSIKSLVVGGAAMNPAIIRLLQVFGIELDVGYGLTEAGPIVSLGISREYPLESVGKPLPGTHVHVDPKTGEILLQSPSTINRYWNDRDATNQLFVDGWLKTGDYGYLDKNGFLYIKGRLKNVIVTENGTTIFPEEVEYYYENQAFSEICVVGLPDDDGNDVPTLFTVPSDPQITDTEVQRVFQNLRADAPSKFAVKRMIRLDQPLPKTATGKVRRRQLALEFGEQLS